MTVDKLLRNYPIELSWWPLQEVLGGMTAEVFDDYKDIVEKEGFDVATGILKESVLHASALDEVESCYHIFLPWHEIHLPDGVEANGWEDEYGNRFTEIKGFHVYIDKEMMRRHSW